MELRIVPDPIILSSMLKTDTVQNVVMTVSAISRD